MKNLTYCLCTLICTTSTSGMQNHPATRGAKRKIEALQAIKTLTPEQATQKLQAFIKKNRILPSNPYTLEELQTLINQGADVNTTVSQDTTALMRAAVYENLGAMRALIDAGADVNKRRDRDTALSCAIFYDRLAAVQLLIESRCSPHTLSDALVDAVMRNPNNKEIIQLLLDAGASPKVAIPYWGRGTIADHVLKRSLNESTSSEAPVFKEIWQLFINKHPELKQEHSQVTH